MSDNKSYLLTVARPSHIEDIIKLALRAFREGAEGSLPVNSDKVRGIVEMLVRDDHQLALVAISGGKPKGIILGHVDAHAYCDGLVASDICIYVAPTLRGTTCAADLVEAYAKWCGRIPNLLGSTIGIAQINHTTPYMEHLFKANGYHKSGLTYIKLKES
jgi:GNAT superfamily N-acetyltransferase